MVQHILKRLVKTRLQIFEYYSNANAFEKTSYIKWQENK